MATKQPLKGRALWRVIQNNIKCGVGGCRLPINHIGKHQYKGTERL